MKRAEKQISLFCLSLLASIFLYACDSSDRLDGHLHYRINANPSTLDPALIVDVTGGLIAAKLFNGLVRLDDNLEVMPDLAGSWDVSPDGTIYEFSIRPDARFSNGRPVTSEDVRYSFERVLDPKGRSPNTWVFEKIAGAKAFMSGTRDAIDGITVIDHGRIRIRLEEPFSPFLNMLTTTSAYIVPKEEVKRWGEDFGFHPTGTGPFILEEWRHNNHLLLSKNVKYFGQQPQVQGIRYRIIPEDLTAVAEFELNNLDVLSVPASEYGRLMKQYGPENRISAIKGINTYYLGFNCSRPPFGDKKARRAVSMAIDRKKILETFYEGRGRLAAGPVPDNLRRWPVPIPAQYDPAEAKRLAGESGLQQREIKFYVTADPEVVDLAEIIQFYLRRVGLNIKIVQLEWSAYKTAINNGEADMFWISWWADYPDPENFLYPLFHSSNHGPGGNRTRYTNRDVDLLIESGRRALSRTGRDRFYAEAERMIVDDAPWVFFWHRNDAAVRNERLRNFRVYPIYSMDKATEVSF